MSTTLIYALVFITIIIPQSYVYGQANNSYTFIEPNISISYDSNMFNHEPHYVNTDESQSPDLFYKKDSGNNFQIHIEAHYSKFRPSLFLQDSIISKEFEQITTLQNDSIPLHYSDKKPVYISGFSCLRYLFCNKHDNKKCIAMIMGLKLFDYGYSQIAYQSNDRSDIEKESGVVQAFLAGLRFYTRNQIDSEDTQIRAKYTVVVDSAKDAFADFKDRSFTYRGNVYIKEKLRHRVSEVRITGPLGEEIFSPNKNGQVPVTCYDKEQGIIIKRGEFVLLNSFGKQVKIPFTFSYKNNFTN